MTSFKILSPLLLVFFFACATKNVTIAEKPPTPEEAAVIASIPGPPAPGSAEDTADYETLKKLEKSRTQKDCDRAASEVVPVLNNLYGPAFGPLTKKEVESLTPLFDNISQQTYHPDLIGMAKRQFHRPRPFVTHTDLNPCVKREPSLSYPSGHAAISRIYYHVLSELYPERTKQFLTRADQIAYDRNLGGVHYPSDIRDGKVLGDKAYEFMSKTEVYQKSIADFKAKK